MNNTDALVAAFAGIGWALALRGGIAYLVTRRKYLDLIDVFDEADRERLQLRAFVDRQLLKRRPVETVHIPPAFRVVRGEVADDA